MKILENFIKANNSKAANGKIRNYQFEISSETQIADCVNITILYVVSFIRGSNQVSYAITIGYVEGPTHYFDKLCEIVTDEADRWIAAGNFTKYDDQEDAWELEDKNRITEKIKEKLCYITSNESDLKFYSESIYNILMDEK